MKYTLSIDSSEKMISFGERIGRELEENMVILMEGDLGAGKTTLTKGIAKALGVERVVNSPTFTILKIYDGRLKLYHMDVYRLSNDSGDEYLEEYFEAGGVFVKYQFNILSNGFFIRNLIQNRLQRYEILCKKPNIP